MIGLARFEAKVCDCGFHEALARDPGNHFTFDVDACPVCKGAAQYGRVLAASDEQARKALGENRPPATPDPADGRRVLTRLMAADEVAARRTNNNP